MTTKIPGMDMEKFGEVFRETSVVKIYIPLEKLQETKDCLIAIDEKFKDVELSRVQNFFDLYNSVFVAVKTYHERYGFSDDKITEEKKPEIPKIPENNKERHKLNKLRAFATLDEKVKWHIDHVANCKCGHMPKYVRKEIEKRLG